ncbi:hypothetical protein GWK41_00315 [Persephonella atlantica]|uniref:Uncharacterized protein n=1 Tax=Persephonella atlantica TaxID=2699429 RepID=A0ABS1GF03_9AQUI|nr:hypothetical protein [Persephonella atlantica]MBK3331504.1 hypothetical protein [Persephonella atlantica]
MVRYIFPVIFVVFLLFVKSYSETLTPSEGLTESQIYNIRTYSLRALNLVLDAYSSLNKKRIIKKESYAYLDASLFFLNEAYQYSPTYTVIREIEALIKRINLYPEESYETDIRVITVQIEEISAPLKDYTLLKEKLQQLYQIASRRDNSKLSDELKEIKKMLKIPLIDIPLSEARFLIGVAKDHLKAGEIKKSQQSLELALTPLIKIGMRENLYIVLTLEYLSKAKFSYRVDPDMSKGFFKSALYSINKAYLVSSEENRNTIKSVKEKIITLFDRYNSYSISENDFDSVIRILKDM